MLPHEITDKCFIFMNFTITLIMFFWHKNRIRNNEKFIFFSTLSKKNLMKKFNVLFVTTFLWTWIMKEIFSAMYLCVVYLILIDIIYYRRNKYMTEKQQTKKVAKNSVITKWNFLRFFFYFCFLIFFNVWLYSMKELSRSKTKMVQKQRKTTKTKVIYFLYLI